MPGAGEPGCVIFQYSWDILERWPKLEYLPRPEPPEDKVSAHKRWLKEYSQWKHLQCKRQEGAYFCRRHGKWVTCEELEANLASPQKDERYRDQHRCPASHYDWERMEERFFEDQRKEIDDLAIRNAAAHNQVDDNAYIAPGIESQLENLSLDAPYYQETAEAYPPQQHAYNPSDYSNYPDYTTESISEEPYESPITSKRDSKSSTGYQTSRPHGKNSSPQSSKPHSSRSYSSKPQSSKSSRPNPSHDSQRPTTSSTSSQKQHASRNEHEAEDSDTLVEDSDAGVEDTVAYYEPYSKYSTYAAEEYEDPNQYSSPYWSRDGGY